MYVIWGFLGGGLIGNLNGVFFVLFFLHILIFFFFLYLCSLWQRVVSDVTAAHDRELLFQANENLIVKIQANYRGYQARKAYKERLDFMKRQLPLIIKIQVKGWNSNINSHTIPIGSNDIHFKNKSLTGSTCIQIDSDLCIIYFFNVIDWLNFDKKLILAISLVSKWL